MFFDPFDRAGGFYYERWGHVCAEGVDCKLGFLLLGFLVSDILMAQMGCVQLVVAAVRRCLEHKTG